jgi:glycosyltransferase involved in cell wall biosynthesis
VSRSDATSPRVVRLASFPPVIAQNPYQRLLYEHLAPLGVRIVEGAELKLRWLVRNRRAVDVLHFHWPQGYYQWSGEPACARRPLSWVRLGLFSARLAAARALGYRVWWTIHQVYPHETTSRAVDRRAGRRLVRAATVLTAHDRATAEAAVRELGAEPEAIVIVPHGSYVGVYPAVDDTEHARRAVRQELGLPEEAFVFLSFGHLRRYKEVELLLDAFAAVRNERARLVIAGLPLDEHSARAVEAAAAQDPRVCPVLEFVPDERVAELFAGADAAVLARGDGGTSGALVLSLSLGAPVVAANVPTCEELLHGEEAGWLFTAGDPGSLSAALEQAAADPAAAAAKAARAREIAEGLAWDPIAERLAELLGAATAPEPSRLASVNGGVDLLLTCSSGGHLLQLLALREVWEPFDRVWVTDDRSDTRSLLAGEPVVFAHWPTSRTLRTLPKNLMLAWRLVRRARPAVVLTTGAGTAVPFTWVARLHRARVVHIETLTRIDSPSLSCRLIAPIADRVYVQWPDLERAVRRSRYAGSVLSE